MSLVDSSGTAIVPTQYGMPQMQTVSLDLLRWQAKVDFDAAMIALGDDLKAIPKLKKIVIQGVTIKYAAFENIHEIVMPLLRKHGFYFTFQGEEINGVPWIRGYLRRGGWQIDSLWLVDHTPVSKAMNPNQAIGAGATYACRHLMVRLLNLNLMDPALADTDGVERDMTPVAPLKVITSKQVKELETLIDGDKTLMARIENLFFKELGIIKLSEFPAAQFGSLKTKIITYNKRKAEVAK